ncbi:MarR family winged helix-turn-helix transcriptional regulator [Frondihabitans sp. VKM Ac-2883]|uniref:MarR family winged helix-turn-helix transcriptional regulator n=1 Tax=Frondihabitans sp. VKM Ac-2883 TaxID=2783823 RepID=UPI00188AD001|nr:MarR family winged helix-turn-helix transcriptional regulator [Frondihabitans sp. VKM Ac-2883]MBF4577911.1 winged helix-turn-helix transcriptional regulator [Frondihabitans sp. VKM Ac-2883]
MAVVDLLSGVTNNSEEAAALFPLVEAMSALQTAEALLRWRLRDLFDLRANEMVALEYLARLEHLGQPVRVLDVARVLGVTNGAGTIIVACLMERGLVTRTENPRDGRSKLLQLTPKAATAFADALGGSRMDLRILLAGLSLRERKRLIVLLTAVTDSLNRSGFAAST